MKYREAVQQITTKRALEMLGQRPQPEGSYLTFQCLCGAKAVIKTFGEKKNLYYCESCKKGGNIIGLAMELKGIEYLEAKELLLKAIPPQEEPEELKLDYELEYCDLLAKEGIDEELCRKLGVGKPKGRTMLSGHLVFTVYEGEKKIAYYGISLADRKPKFHKSFNPENHLYSFTPGEEIWVTTDMLKCLRLIQEGKPACCNFGLPYLSLKHYELLNQCERVNIDWQFTERRGIAASVAENLKTYHRFV